MRFMTVSTVIQVIQTLLLVFPRKLEDLERGIVLLVRNVWILNRKSNEYQSKGKPRGIYTT